MESKSQLPSSETEDGWLCWDCLELFQVWCCFWNSLQVVVGEGGWVAW